MERLRPKKEGIPSPGSAALGGFQFSHLLGSHQLLVLSSQRTYIFLSERFSLFCVLSCYIDFSPIIMWCLWCCNSNILCSQNRGLINVHQYLVFPPNLLKPTWSSVKVIAFLCGIAGFSKYFNPFKIDSSIHNVLIFLLPCLRYIMPWLEMANFNFFTSTFSPLLFHLFSQWGLPLFLEQKTLFYFVFYFCWHHQSKSWSPCVRSPPHFCDGKILCKYFRLRGGS